jgi:hypothetical protein
MPNAAKFANTDIMENAAIFGNQVSLTKLMLQIPPVR